MSIAIISPRYPPAIGGVERVSERQARAIVAHGLPVDVLTTDPTRTLARAAVMDGVRVRRFPTIANDSIYYLSPSLWRWLMKYASHYSLLHAHSYHTPIALAAALASRRSGVPFVLTTHYHGTGHTPLRRLLHYPYRPLGRWMVRSADHIFCVSQHESHLIKKHFGNDLPLSVVPNGIDLDEINRAISWQKKDEDTILLSVGRLERYKQNHHLIEAMTKLDGRYKLVIIGDGPDRVLLKRIIDNLELNSRVFMPGFVEREDLLRWYKTADIFVTLSTHEAFGISILEASVAGSRIVASNIFAHQEVLRMIPDKSVNFISPVINSDELITAILHASNASNPDIISNDLIPTWDHIALEIIQHYKTLQK